MATLTNSFEGGTAGATITTGNSGGGSGDAWTLSDDTTGGTCTYSDAGAAHGSRCMSVTLGGTGGPSRRGWAVNPGDSVDTQFFRFYVDPASITGTVSPLRGMNAGSTGQRFRVQVTSGGVLTLHNNANATLWTSSVMAGGTQWRVELEAGGTTSTSARVRIYAGDATTTTQDSGDLAGVNMGGPTREVWFGQTNSATNVAVKLDDCGWSDTALLGPVSSPTVSGVLAATLPGLGVAVAGGGRSAGAAVGVLPPVGAAFAGSARSGGALVGVLPGLSAAVSGGAAGGGVLAGVLPALAAGLVGGASVGGGLALSLPALSVSLSDGGSGVVVRPDAGVVVRPSAGVVARPDAGAVVRP